MRRVLWALIALTTLVIVSCTKEESFEEGTGNNGGGNTDGDLLTRIVIQLGQDSATTSFTYDGSKRLLSETHEGPMSLMGDDSLQRITRNTAGIIQKVTIYPTTSPNDSYEYILRFNAASNRYTSKLLFDVSGNLVDSIDYGYNASGRIVTATYFANFGGGFELLGKDSIVYDGNNNISRVVTKDYNGAEWEDLGEMIIQYDNRVNPLKLLEEAVVLDRYQYYGNNNPTKITLVDFDDPAASEEITLAYTYNASDKPLTANIGMMGVGGATLPAVFRYQ